MEDAPLKDHGSFVNFCPNEADIAGHHREKWQDQAMYIGLHYPKDIRKRRHHRHHQQQHSRHRNNGTAAKEPEVVKPVTPPSQRVQFLLGNDEIDDDDHQAHDMFCEMEELRTVGEDGDREWKEIARWIKFEEDVEEGGERWSKPHVATLSLHSLFELRRGITNGTILLDTPATSILQISELVLDSMIASGQLNAIHRQTVQEVLLSRHRHQHQRRNHEGVKGLPMIRSLALIGHIGSDRKMEAMSRANQSAGFLPSMANRASTKDLQDNDIPRNASSSDIIEANTNPHRFNEHFLKKIPAGAEASNILVGELECLEDCLVVFIRLQKAVLFADLTEVSVPTRFIFIQLGPVGHMQRYHEIGRSMATLLSDEVFHDVAYKARDRRDLLAGIDEFLDCVTVLPPGEWDPAIRIEPPKAVPSQEKRKKPDPPPNGGYMSPINEESISTPVAGAVVSAAGVPGGSGGGGGGASGQEHAEAESHCDPTLVRTGRIFGGLVQDVKRKVPWYLSDIRDALHVQCIASFFFMYFACLAPIITFGGLLGKATNNYIAAMESLVSGAICGISYHLFSGQPLTVIGSTGPVLVFETIVFKFCTDHSLNYLCFRFWIGMWMCLALLLMVAFDLSALVRYITRFTEESFAMLIALIFIVEAFKKLIEILDKDPVNLHPDAPLDYSCMCYPPGWQPDTNSSNSTMDTEWFSTPSSYSTSDVFFFSCLLFIATFALAMSLKFFRNTRFFPNQVRVMVSDFAVCTAILVMVAVDILVGLGTPKLEVPLEFQPTSPNRGWVVNPFVNTWYWIFAAIPPALLATILIFMDQQITAVIVNRKENKLQKGSGYHLDLLVITVQIGVCSLLGTPWFVAATVLSINHIRSLTRESESAAPGERPKFLGVREQRVTGTAVFIMVGLSALMANILKFIPMPVLYGVFLFMGVSSLKGIQMMQRVLIMFMPSKYQPDYMYLRNVPLRRVHLFTVIQGLCLAGLWVIKSIKQISIIFPIMVLAMCFIRKGLEWIFTRHELKWLDDIMPESHKREKADKKKSSSTEKIDDEQLGEVTVDVGDNNDDGKAVDIPLVEIKKTPEYVPVANRIDVNISEEMSKTGIWHHLNSQPRFQTAPPQNLSSNDLKQRKPTKNDRKESLTSKDPTVKFSIADEDDDELVSEKNALVKSPSN